MKDNRSARRSHYFQTSLRTDALAKLIIEDGIITEAEFPAKIAEERSTTEKAHRDSLRRESFGPASQDR
jgi:hypothetical protein